MIGPGPDAYGGVEITFWFEEGGGYFTYAGTRVKNRKQLETVLKFLEEALSDAPGQKSKLLGGLTPGQTLDWYIEAAHEQALRDEERRRWEKANIPKCPLCGKETTERQLKGKNKCCRRCALQGKQGPGATV